MNNWEGCLIWKATLSAAIIAADCKFFLVEIWTQVPLRDPWSQQWVVWRVYYFCLSVLVVQVCALNAPQMFEAVVKVSNQDIPKQFSPIILNSQRISILMKYWGMSRFLFQFYYLFLGVDRSMHAMGLLTVGFSVNDLQCTFQPLEKFRIQVSHLFKHR